MLQKALHKAQLASTNVSDIHNYPPTAALLHLESLKMLLQEADSAYPADITDTNEYCL